MASYVALWCAVIVLGLIVLALLRQIGVLHARVQPMGAHPAGEGPEIGTVAPLAGPEGYDSPGLTLVVFTSPGCEVCATLRPSLAALTHQYRHVSVVELEHETATAATFRAFNVASTPYFVVVDPAGVVRGSGVANTLEQIEELLDASERPPEPARNVAS